MKHNPPAPNAKEIRDAIYSYAPYDLLRVLVLPKNLIRGRISRLMCEFGVREMSDNRELRPTRSDELSAFWPPAQTARAHRFEPRRDSGSTSGSTSRVAMMQAANLRNRDDFAKRRRLDLTRRRRVAIERQVRPDLVIIAEVISKDSLQMPFVQHDDMVQAFSPYTPDYTFGGWPRFLNRGAKPRRFCESAGHLAKVRTHHTRPLVAKPHRFKNRGHPRQSVRATRGVPVHRLPCRKNERHPAIIGSFGCHLGRKSDGPPGPKAIWIGLRRVMDFALAWNTFGPKTDRDNPPDG